MLSLKVLKQTDELAGLAIKEVDEKYDTSEQLETVKSILANTLASLPEDRWGMTEVLSLLAPWANSPDDSDDSVEYEADILSEAEDAPSINADTPEVETDDHASMLPILAIKPEPFYNDVGFQRSRFVPLPIPLVREVLRSL